MQTKERDLDVRSQDDREASRAEPRGYEPPAVVASYPFEEVVLAQNFICGDTSCGTNCQQV